VSAKPEISISVDIETAGPIPGEYSMLSIGACNVYDETQGFSCEIKPISEKADPKALEVSGLSLAKLKESGLAPEDAMQRFDAWAKAQATDDATLVFVGLNAAFDWSFVNYYFHKYVGANPFGFAALDIKAYYMGATGCAWADTRSSRLSADLKPERQSDHTALRDAQYQAELFRLMRARVPLRRPTAS
jgi:ribonuclease T